MEIYLDANATTPVLPQARAAALAVMEDTFGNPSSLHGSGLRARAMLDQARASARRVLAIDNGQLLFTSGATEGIQTAVLSALSELRRRQQSGGSGKLCLLYGATEHKAVPEALHHWNRVLGLDCPVQAIPVGRDGLHDLAWLRDKAATAGLVCTMAANNETGVISDLEGIERALAASQALWMVDSVQALGKLSLDLARRRIDYAPFSGHKLYAPKGVGMLYVREGAPFTPLMMGGGQEGALRSGTENMAGIAALGAVLQALEEGQVFRDRTTLAAHHQRLATALSESFEGLVFNAPSALCLPTTLNFSVRGLSSKMLLDLFDAAGMRVSGGSACGAAKALPSDVLEAMGLPRWQTASAVRLSFGAADDTELIERACARIRACGNSLRANCLTALPAEQPAPVWPMTRLAVDGACCYLVAAAETRECLVIDPLPELTERLSQWVRCRGYKLRAVLDTHRRGDRASAAEALRAAVPAELRADGAREGSGWPMDTPQITLGGSTLTRLALRGHTADSTAYLLHRGEALQAVFMGDAVMPDALGRSAFEHSEPAAHAASLLKLEKAVGPDALLLPGHDDDNRFATTLTIERLAQPPAAEVHEGRRDLELGAEQLTALLQRAPDAVLVDVREPYEQMLGDALPTTITATTARAVPLSALPNALPEWLALPQDTPVVFYCRSGNRSAQAARALRRLGHEQAWSLAGGLALWPQCASCS